MLKRIVVISDIHANANTLELVLSKIRLEEIDLCVILGDLLTYGTQPNEVIELLLDFKNKVKCIFIKGNHEQFYFDIENNINPIKYKMPEFVQESILWTNKQLNYKLSEILEWHEKFEINKIYFSHANPFKFGNWTYMNKETDILDAARSLDDKSMAAGVFGHTHRDKDYIIDDKFSNCDLFHRDQFSLSSNNKLILGTGSIGQPRGSLPSFIILNIKHDLLQIHRQKVLANNRLNIQQINNTSLSLETKNKLNSFWEIK